MRTLISLACILALSGCAVVIKTDHDIRTSGTAAREGNGQVAVEKRAIGALSGIEMTGSVHMDVRVGAEPSLQVEGDSNLLPMVRTEVKGSSLKVWIDGAYRSTKGLRVTYVTPQLNQIAANGSGHLTVSDLNGGSLTFNHDGSGDSKLSGRVSNLNLQLNGSGRVDAEQLRTSGNANLNLSGSGRVAIGDMRAESVNVNLRGSGTLDASGSANHLNAFVMGSGGANLSRLTSERADLKTHGSGDITARVSSALVASTMGSGRITVYGNPAERSITGKNVDVLI